MYTYNKKILFSDIDSGSRMSVGGILNAMQDCVNINSESIGRGIDYMLKKRRTWFAISWNIEIVRRPGMFEDVVVKTWPYDFTSAMGFRNVIITDESGEDIIKADSVWTLVDMDEGKPTRIEEEDAKGYDLEPKYPMEQLPRKIKLPKEFTAVDTIVVRKADIDYNGHMSNGKYIEIADEYIPFDTNIRRIRVEYKNQARYKERLRVDMAIDGNRYVIRMSGVDDGSIKAIVEVLV